MGVILRSCSIDIEGSNIVTFIKFKRASNVKIPLQNDNQYDLTSQ